MGPKCVRGGFSRGAKKISDEYAEKNISSKLDAFTRDIKVWLIFDHNSCDYSV